MTIVRAALSLASVVLLALLVPALARAEAEPATCPGGQAGIFAVKAVNHTLHVGSTPLALVTGVVTNRVDGFSVDDVTGPFPGFDPGGGVALFARGQSGRLRAPAGVQLLGGDAMAFAWDGRTLPRTAGRPLAVHVDGGGLAFTYPAAGRYLIEFGVRWQSTCLKGDGVAVMAVDSGLPPTDTADAVRPAVVAAARPVASIIGATGLAALIVLVVGRRGRRSAP